MAWWDQWNPFYKPKTISPIPEKNTRTIKGVNIEVPNDWGSDKPASSATMRNIYATPTPTAMPTPTPYPTPRDVPVDPEVEKFLTSTVFPITRKYEIPDAVAAGQFAGEGRLKGLGASRNNYYNIGAFDSNVNNAYGYESPEQGVEAYAKLLSGKYQRSSGDMDERYLPAWELRATPSAMMKKIKELGYASRPDYDTFIMSTPEWKRYSY